MGSERRRGSEDSETRERLLDAAEELLRTQGHSAVTVRRIVAKAGVKRALVHYYFRSMEDLFLEVLQRAYNRHFARLLEALRDPNPVRALWNAAFLADAALFEIYTLPLANQFESVRESIADFMTKSRRIQVEALRQLIKKRARSASLMPSPEAIAVFIRGVAREIAVEKQLGIVEAHTETLSTVEKYLKLFDPSTASED